jgi:transcriptional regulator with XRE-family HTH domain
MNTPRRSRPSEAPPAAGLCQRLRAIRAGRDWSLDDLARASGVSRSMLSQIERGRANPTLAVAFRIAHAFGLSLGELVEAPADPSRIAVIRAGDPAFHYRSDRYCTIRTLSPLQLEKDVEFYEVRLQRRGALRSAAHFQGTREFLTVVQGRIQVESGSQGQKLGPGDSAHYRADLAHAIVNLGPGSALVFLVVIYP